jgi:hypothetical protein
MMFREYKWPSAAGVWGGSFLFFVGYLIRQAPQPLYVTAGHLVMAGAAILFLAGCFLYARGKGRSPYWGVAGFLGPLGLLLLYCLKDYSGRLEKKRAAAARVKNV